MVLFLRVYSSGAMAEYPVTNRKGPIKPLKIRPSAIRPIDIVLRGSVVTWFISPALATSYSRYWTPYYFALCRASMT
jgi:hypothetical protein